MYKSSIKSYKEDSRRSRTVDAKEVYYYLGIHVYFKCTLKIKKQNSTKKPTTIEPSLKNKPCFL